LDDQWPLRTERRITTDGQPYLILRMYWPKTEAPSILPAGKGTWAPPGIVKANCHRWS
jgi:hypothetical protein